MLACFVDRLRDSYELTDDDGLEPMARERLNLKVIYAVAEYATTLHLGPDQVVRLRYETRMVRCQRCNGAFTASRDRCPKCLETATPATQNPVMIAHLAKAEKQAKRNIRRAEAKRKPAVFKIVREASNG